MCVSVCVFVCASVTSGTPVRPAHMHPCQRLLCLLSGARATELLVIGCVGSIMTLGGGRRQRSMKQNTALCASLGTLWFLRSPSSALTPQRCQKVSKVEAMRYHSVLLLSVLSEMPLLYNLPQRELLYLLKNHRESK